VRENGLTIFFGGFFLLTLIGQGLTGLAFYNREQRSADLDPINPLQYVTSSAFAVDVAENWQSEYLQLLLYIVATVWFVQRGSPESKELEVGVPHRRKHGCALDLPAQARIARVQARGRRPLRHRHRRLSSAPRDTQLRLVQRAAEVVAQLTRVEPSVRQSRTLG